MHSAFWHHLTDADDADKLTLRRTVSDLLSRDEVREEVERKCEQIIDELLEMHRDAIRALPDDHRQPYNQIEGSGGGPTENHNREYPERISHRSGDQPEPFEKHLYVPESAGTFETTLNQLERRVIEAEIAADDVSGWLRNVDRQRWAVAIPVGGESLMYPDFLVIRRDGEHLVADLLDPHGAGLADSVNKAKALASYAEDHGALFGRMQLIDDDGGTLRRLDLLDRNVRLAINRAVDAGQLRDVFKDHGFAGRLGP